MQLLGLYYMTGSISTGGASSVVHPVVYMKTKDNALKITMTTLQNATMQTDMQLNTLVILHLAYCK